MKFLSRRDLITLARRTAYPNTIHVRNETGLRAVLEIPPERTDIDGSACKHDDTDEDGTPSEEIVFSVVGEFATLLVRFAPFSAINLEIAAHSIEQLLFLNGYQCNADSDDLAYQLSRVEVGTIGPEALASWLKEQAEVVDDETLLTGLPPSITTTRDP